MVVTLLNGRGQLGNKLYQKLQHYIGAPHLADIAIYHTWKVPWLSDTAEFEETQHNEYLKLVEFSKNNPKTKIIFVSTNSARGTHYTYFKEQAEAYLLSNHKSSIILKFPLFIGKGVIERIKNKEIEPYGTMEIITLDKVAETIEEYLNYEGLKRVFTIEGEKIQAKTVAEILKV